VLSRSRQQRWSRDEPPVARGVAGGPGAAAALDCAAALSILTTSYPKDLHATVFSVLRMTASAGFLWTRCGGVLVDTVGLARRDSS